MSTPEDNEQEAPETEVVETEVEETEVVADPMEMSKEEYDQSVSDMLNAEPEVEAETEAEAEPETEAESDEQLFEIMYKGEKKKLTRKKMDELAQKGFSYHADMNRIAPHKKLVTLIEQDPEIGKMVNDYVQERAKPKMSKLEDFDTEEAWLEDNLKKQQKATQFKEVKTNTPGQEIISFFREKDPDNYEKVLTAIGEHANNLTVTEYAAINKDMDKLEEFYEVVKTKVLGTAQAKPKQTFRSRSGGGAPQRTTTKSDSAWEMSSKDFNKLLQKVKGY